MLCLLFYALVLIICVYLFEGQSIISGNDDPEGYFKELAAEGKLKSSICGHVWKSGGTVIIIITYYLVIILFSSTPPPPSSPSSHHSSSPISYPSFPPSPRSPLLAHAINMRISYLFLRYCI